MTVNQPQSQCTTSGTVAVPHFHFYAGWKEGAPAFFSVDWILIEELTNEHTPQIWYLPNPQGSSGFPHGCTMPPVSDPENWNWTTWSLAGAMIGFAMHNTSYRVTVQWRYGVYMKGPRGPFQTSITINVQNLAVTSPDETKVLKWDPDRGIAETSFSYSLECAQRKVCDVCISIYSTDGRKVYEVWLEKEAPGSYSFTWDGSVNVVPPQPPPDGKAPAGLYVFDIEVIGIAPGYDEDTLRSRALWIGEHKVYLLATPWQKQPSYQTPSNHVVRAEYLLHDIVQASKVIIEVYDPDLLKVTSVNGTTKTIPEWMIPQPEDWNIVEFSASFPKSTRFIPYIFVYWAWDGHMDTYKNHTSKTMFNNCRCDKLNDIQWLPCSFDKSYDISYLIVGNLNRFLRSILWLPDNFLYYQPTDIAEARLKGINWRWDKPQTAHFYVKDAVRGDIMVITRLTTN